MPGAFLEARKFTMLLRLDGDSLLFRACSSNLVECRRIFAGIGPITAKGFHCYDAEKRDLDLLRKAWNRHTRTLLLRFAPIFQIFVLRGVGNRKDAYFSPQRMILTVLKEGAQFALIVGTLYFALSGFARWRRGELSQSIERNRMLILLLLALAVTAIKVGEEVLEGASGPIDETTLRYIHEHVPREMEQFFRAVTFTGSWLFLCPLVALVSVALFATRKHFEALLLIISETASALVIYVIKTAVGRARPALWETDWYWGSSFPSGHTLHTAAVASALLIGLARIRPEMVRIVAPFAAMWILLVALSRLVLGVHWPSDVLTAACLGVIIPFIVLLILQRANARALRPRGA